MYQLKHYLCIKKLKNIMRALKFILAGLLLISLCSCSVLNGLHHKKVIKQPTIRTIKYDKLGLIAKN